MAQVRTVATKYARGLYEASSSADLVVTRDLFKALANQISSNPELRNAVRNPAIRDSDKLAALEEVLKRLSGSGNAVANVSNALRVLLENKRIEILADVAVVFEEIVARHLAMARVTISSARELDGAERDEYVSRLKKHLGDQAQVSFRVDPELLGGMTVQAGDVLIDGSVKSSLQQLRSALLG